MVRRARDSRTDKDGGRKGRDSGQKSRDRSSEASSVHSALGFPVKMGDKLYVVTHRELEPGYQAVQSQHALFQFSIEHAEAARRWYAFSNYLGFLSVENETAPARVEGC